MIEEYKKNGYVIFDDLLPEEEYKKILDICKNSSYNKISQKRSDRYALWETPDDKFFPDSDEVYENQFWGTDEVVQTDEVKQMFDKFFPDSDEVYENQFWGTDEVVQTDEVKQMFDKYIKPKVLELTNNQAGKFMHQTNMYRNNAKDFLRIHYDDYMGLCGYVFYVGEYQWKYDWGGLLQMRVDDDVKTILPNKNRLVLMNHSLRMGHWVTPTNTWAKENRYTIVGFCIDKDKDLPETWTKRKDQRIDK